MRSSRATNGAALDHLTADVKDDVLDLVRQGMESAEPYRTALMRQALDKPHRARAQITAWIAGYNSRNGGGSAQTYIQQCLAAAGSSATLASIDAELAALEAQAMVVVNHVRNDGWTWTQVANAIRAQVSAAPAETFDYSRLPIPAGYVSVWGTPH